MHQRQQGMTLLELIVAVAIFTFIVSIVYQGISQMVRSRGAAVAISEQLSAVQFTLGRLQQDLMQFNNRPVRDAYGDRQGALLWEAENLHFTRSGWRNLMNQARSESQRVRYFVNDQNQLVRAYSLHTDRPLEDQSIEHPLLDGVQEFRLRVLDQERQWQEDWPPLSRDGSEPKAPRAVEITLQIEGMGEIVRLIELAGGQFDEPA